MMRSSPSRAISSRMCNCSGPIPLIGLMAPPSTWYLPVKARERSMAMTSLDSSTTQMMSSPRRSSRQIEQVSDSETLKHTVQNFTRSLTTEIDWARRFMSSGSASRMWKAIRWADLGPMPGSLPNSSISSWTAPSYTWIHTA